MWMPSLPPVTFCIEAIIRDRPDSGGARRTFSARRSRQPVQVPALDAEAKTTGRRMAFAKWLTRPDHPLTARVMVNRIWSHHLGTGIVRPRQFRKVGRCPSNPALLDWLATEFVERGWSVKAMHRLIMTSTAYRQSSAVRARRRRSIRRTAAVADEPSPVGGRGVARRDVGGIRDLDLQMFGKPVNSETKPSGEVAPENDTAVSRRSIYLIVRRSAPQTFLNSLGAPVMEINCTRRSTYNSPLQALNLVEW